MCNSSKGHFLFQFREDIIAMFPIFSNIKKTLKNVFRKNNLAILWKNFGFFVLMVSELEASLLEIDAELVTQPTISHAWRLVQEN